MPSSKEEREANDAPKEGLCQHQKRRGLKMMPPKKVFTNIKEELIENDVAKEGLYRHQKRS
ncbi:hypothetical protein ACOJQI_20650 [Bacillus salacetis]|uniref:hypothetical protein n=1 Tax=Bacillus salacetis TaxID=2315464 RepID=UPI003BA2BC46